MKKPSNKKGPACTCGLSLAHGQDCPRVIWWKKLLGTAKGTS